MLTITHLYDTRTEAEQACTDLERIGVPSSDISILASDASGKMKTSDPHSVTGTGVAIGATALGGAGLLAGLGMIAIPGLGPVVAAGWFASTLAGVLAGSVAGGLVGAMTEAGVDKEHAHVYAEGVRRGGSLLTVRVADEMATQVDEVLSRYRPVDPVVRGQQYRDSGWKGFDPKAGPFDPPRI